MTNAKVYKPSDIERCVSSCPVLDWNRVLVIDENTLKAIRADAKGYKLSLEELVDAQKKLNEATSEINKLNLEKSKLIEEVNSASDIPWYKSASFWAPVTFVLGVLTTTSIYIAIDKNK